MILRILLYGLLIYFAYKLIFDLIIPVYIASRKIRKGFKEMHNRMQDQMNQQDGPVPPPKEPSTAKRSNDYIDFEEVK